MNKQNLIKKLEQLCLINSGSMHLEGLARVADSLAQIYKPIADNIQLIQSPSFSEINMQGVTHDISTGNMLFIQKRPHLKRRILLCGHMDTVFPKNHPFQTVTYLDNHVMNAPGAADMKGGLIVMHRALELFEQTQASDNLGWDVLITADEEIGSPASSLYFKKIYQDYAVGLIYEPCMNDAGMIAKNRRGSGKLTIIAKGVPAHAGRNFDDGINAIFLLSQALCDIHKLNGLRQGVSINIGKIQGGHALNMVPDTAVAKLDIRISNPSDEAWVRQKIKDILKPFDGAVQLYGEFKRPVKLVDKATQYLFDRLKKVAQPLHVNIDWQDSGGCCDGNNFSNFGMAVLDTLGVRGGHIHTDQEYVLLESLEERAELSVKLIEDLAEGQLEQVIKLQN